MAAVAGRYARAYADVVEENKIDPGKAVRELDEIAALVTQSAELRNVLLNPAVEHDQKLGLLDAIVNRIGGNQLLRNFVAVLMDNKRIHQMADVAVQFGKELDQRMGIADARVSSFRPLTATERKSLEKQLTAVTGKTVRATYAEDSSLLGGALVRVGSTVYDGSVRGQLQRIKQEIGGA
jgi:F-type H+-transporting ATPase subunit delta